MSSQVGGTLKALADDTRRAVVEALGETPLSAGQLAARIDVTPAALSRHLRVLRQAGLVQLSLDEDDSRRHIYAIESGPLHALSEWVGRVAEFWTSQLTSYGRHVRDSDDAGR